MRIGRSTDMTQGTIWKQLLSFAAPMLLGLIFQQMYNTVDSIVVGNYVSSQALAAVGTTGPLINTLLGFFNGFSTGATVVIARAYGAVGYTVRTMKELEAAIEEATSIQDRPVLFDIKVLPKSMTEGYNSWWRGGSVEVGGTEANRAAWQSHLDHVRDARKY